MLHRAELCCTGLHYAAHGCTMLHRAALCCTMLHRAALCCTGLHYAAQGCTGNPDSALMLSWGKTPSTGKISIGETPRWKLYQVDLGPIILTGEIRIKGKLKVYTSIQPVIIYVYWYYLLSPSIIMSLLVCFNVLANARLNHLLRQIQFVYIALLVWLTKFRFPNRNTSYQVYSLPHHTMISMWKTAFSMHWYTDFSATTAIYIIVLNGSNCKN